MTKNVHLHWHRLRKGMCLTCGYHCIDCPVGIASCKCTPKPIHVFEDECKNQWCRVHWLYGYNRTRYPEKFNFLTSEQGWVRQEVFCGPGAYLPKKEKN